VKGERRSDYVGADQEGEDGLRRQYSFGNHRVTLTVTSEKIRALYGIQ
jgi:hypothetical protein